MKTSDYEEKMKKKLIKVANDPTQPFVSYGEYGSIGDPNPPTFSYYRKRSLTIEDADGTKNLWIREWQDDQKGHDDYTIDIQFVLTDTRTFPTKHPYDFSQPQTESNLKDRIERFNNQLKNSEIPSFCQIKGIHKDRNKQHSFEVECSAAPKDRRKGIVLENVEKVIEDLNNKNNESFKKFKEMNFNL